MFGKAEASTSRSSNGSLSFLGAELTITGNVTGDGDLHVDGRVDGDVSCGAVTLGKAGQINGNIVATQAKIAGSVHGTVAAQTLVIEASARVVGDLSYDSVSVETGRASRRARQAPDARRARRVETHRQRIKFGNRSTFLHYDMMANDLVDHETQELLGEIGIELGFFGKFAQTGDLSILPTGVGGGQSRHCLVAPDRLRDLESFGKHVDERGIDVVDAVPIGLQLPVGHGVPPSTYLP